MHRIINATGCCPRHHSDDNSARGASKTHQECASNCVWMHVHERSIAVACYQPMHFSNHTPDQASTGCRLAMKWTSAHGLFVCNDLGIIKRLSERFYRKNKFEQFWNSFSNMRDQFWNSFSNMRDHFWSSFASKRTQFLEKKPVLDQFF